MSNVFTFNFRLDENENTIKTNVDSVEESKVKSEFKDLELELYAIGDNRCGQQGNGTIDRDIENITKIKTFQKKIKNIVTGSRGGSAYIIFDDKTYACCGNNEDGQLGIGHWRDMNAWHEITNFKIKNIYCALGGYHAFCISNSNKLYAVGKNRNNVFGINTISNSCNKWTNISTLLDIKKVSTAADGYSIFLTESGHIYVCGHTLHGGLGLGNDISSPTIQQIKIKIKFRDIYCGCRHTLALDNNYCVWSWGYGANGELGHGDIHNRRLPVIIKYFIKNNIKVNKICCGYTHNIILSLNNKIYCFGSNEHYQCGNGSIEHVYLPTINATLKNERVINIKCGAAHNVIKTADNRYYMWGWNNYGQCLYVNTSISSYLFNPPQHIKRPLLFNSNYFHKDKQIIDIYPGWRETRIIIGNKIENINCLNDHDQDEKDQL